MSLQYFEPGPFPIHFGLCTSKKSFGKEMKRMGIKPAPEFNVASMTTHVFENKDDTPTIAIIVCVNKHDIKNRQIDSLFALFAHEAVHVWQQTKEAMRETNPGSESEAYAIQYFSQLMFNVALEIRGGL